MYDDREKSRSARDGLERIGLARDILKVGLGAGLVIFGIYVCYEILQAIVLLSNGSFVPLVDAISKFSEGSPDATVDSAMQQIPAGGLRTVGVFIYLLLLAVLVSLAKALLSGGIKLLNHDNAKAARDLWAVVKRSDSDEILRQSESSKP